MFIVIKSEHYDCTNLICKKDTLEEAVAAVKDSMAQRIRYDNPFDSLSFLRLYAQACLVLRKGAGQSRPPNRTHSQGLQLFAL